MFSSNLSYLGVDIGTSSIKLVEVDNYKNQARLKTYGYMDAPTSILRGFGEKNNQTIADYINVVAKKAKIETKQVIAALPTFSVFNFIINLPPMPKKDLASAIRWEAKKFIPVPIEEMILDWKVLSKKKNQIVPEIKKDDLEFTPAKKEDKDNSRILLTAAPKTLVANYIDVFRKAKLNLLSLETEAFALSRSLMGNDLSTVIIVDIGATSADICVIEEDVPILNRGIDTGGEDITKAIMNSLNINADRAEQFKRDFGLADSVNKNIPAVIQKSLDSIINEIKYVFELYNRQGKTKIDKVILTGGSAFLPNLPKYLTDLLNLPVIIGDPWDRIVYPLDLKAILQEIGPRMSVAVGLAMRDI